MIYTKAKIQTMSRKETCSKLVDAETFKLPVDVLLSLDCSAVLGVISGLGAAVVSVLLTDFSVDTVFMSVSLDFTVSVSFDKVIFSERIHFNKYQLLKSDFK